MERFKITSRCGEARTGLLSLAHGKVETPCFMPVATNGTVKTLVPRDLEELGVEIMLANTYHLSLRPGIEVIKKFSGLHRLLAWQRPILTDSGGFQVFSLSDLCSISDDGVTFRNHLDGQKKFFTPETVVSLQENFASDIHMVLDECPPYSNNKQAISRSLKRSLAWARRARSVKSNDQLAQFAIIQGGVFTDLRRECCLRLQELNFDGYAIGGLSVGEPTTEMRKITELCCQQLADNSKPRYLMGVGTPLDLVESVALGVDMFDCVMPTRNARNGTLFTSTGRLNIKGRQFATSDQPLDEHCTCYTCQTTSRALLRHLFKAKELTVMRLLTIHNLHFYMTLMRQIREAIVSQTFQTLLAQQRQLWRPLGVDSSSKRP